jgi:hypothetical protein
MPAGRGIGLRPAKRFVSANADSQEALLYCRPLRPPQVDLSKTRRLGPFQRFSQRILPQRLPVPQSQTTVPLCP